MAEMRRIDPTACRISAPISRPRSYVSMGWKTPCASENPQTDRAQFLRHVGTHWLHGMMVDKVGGMEEWKWNSGWKEQMEWKWKEQRMEWNGWNGMDGME